MKTLGHPLNTLGLTADRQMEHGVELLRDFEATEPDDPQAHRYLAAGMASCFTALFRLYGEDPR